MLDLLRKNANSWIIYLMFAIIIVVFALTFGTITPDQACGGAGPGMQVQSLADVGPREVDTNLLNMALTFTVDPPRPGAQDLRALQQGYAYRSTRFALLGIDALYPDFGPDPLFTSPIKAEKAMNDLVETLLVAEAARATGLAVSDRELTKRLITKDWYDPETGEFRRRDYDNFVRFQLGTTPPRFESFVRDELLREKMITLLVGGVDLSAAELALHHAASGDKVDLAAVIVDDAAAAALAPLTDEELTGWLAEHQDAVATWYEEHVDEFKKPERVVVRGIQVKAPNRALIELEKDEAKKAEREKERADARARAETVKAELDAAATTAAAPAPAEEAAAEEAPAPAEEAAAEEAPAAAEEAAPAPAPEPAGGKVVSVEAFAEAVTKHSDHSGTKDTGGLFEVARSREEMGRWPFGPDAADAVFGLRPGQVSGVIEVDSGFWILRLDQKLAAEERSLDAARVEIARRLLREEKATAFKKTLAEELLAQAQKDPVKPLQEAVDAVNARYGATEGGLAVQQTGPFARLPAGGSTAEPGTVPGVGTSEALVRAAFAATDAQPLLGGVYEVDDGARLVVAQVSGRESAGELDDAAREALRTQLLRDKQRAVYRGWYEDRLARARTEGDVGFTDAWKETVKAAVDAYRESGGVLPGAPPEPVEDAPAE